jgi:N,N'-diacetyllegionaminate synthase
MRIGDVDLDEQVLVIAEVGNNHEGDMDLALDLVGLAAASGAGAVKFQTIEPEQLVSPLNTERIAQLERFRLPADAWPRLRDAAAEHGVLFLSTPFDLEAVAMLDALVPAFKVASGDNDFVPLLRAVARTGKPVLLSTGLTDLDGIRQAKSVLDDEWAEAGTDPGLVVLHCVVSYPTEPNDANVAAVATLATLGVTPGYSDHTIGTDAAVLSVALGARVIEKHFTIAKDHSPFRDHQLSADPQELALLVERVRAAELLLGDGVKRVMDVEAGAAAAVRRGIAAAGDLDAGHLLELSDLLWVRPATGLRPGEEGRLLGRRLLRPVRRGESLTAEHVG